MINSNELNLTAAEIQQKIQELESQLAQLGEEGSSLGENPARELTELQKIKLSEKAKRRLEIKAIIKSYSEILKKRLYLDKEIICESTYIEGTERALQNTETSEELEFSWGLDELESDRRKVIFQGTTGDGTEKEPVTVTEYGEFRFLEGKSKVSIGDIPYEPISRSYEISSFLRFEGKNLFKAEDIKQIIEKDYRDMHEKIKLLKISKGEGENAREYFIFSPVTEKDLEDPEIQKFFLDFYCSDPYLKQVVSGENGRYAGRIKKSADGTCKIGFKENSVRAAKLAKSIPGTTQIMVESIDGSGTLKFPGGYEFLGQMLDRFTIESYRNNQEGR